MDTTEHTITKLASEGISQHLFPGCVIGVVTRDGKKKTFPFGRFTYDNSSSSVKIDTIYDVASVTKAIPVSCLALKLIEEKRLSLSDTLISYIPQYEGSHREDITILHLLTQTLAFSFSLSKFSKNNEEQILQTIYTAKLSEKPGNQYAYSNTSSILLGMVLEKVTGKTINVLADEYFFEPLGMHATTFYPQQSSQDTIVPSEKDSNGDSIVAVVHDESARILSKKSPVGSAGLFSTTPDLLVFLQMLLQRGTLNNRRFLQRETIEQMYTNQFSNTLFASGLGWEIGQGWMGKEHSNKSFGKTGFTGCLVFCDVEKGIGIVMLSNHIYPYRGKSRLIISKFRSALIDSILSSDF